MYTDKSKIKVRFAYINPKKYDSPGKMSLYLTDYNGKLLYSLRRETDISTINRFKKIFIDDHKVEWCE